MSRFAKLIEKCAEFERLAANVVDKTTAALVQGFKAQLRRVANFLPSQYQAKQIFDRINSIRASATNPDVKLQSDPIWQELQRILVQLEFYEQKLPNAAQLVGI